MSETEHPSEPAVAVPPDATPAPVNAPPQPRASGTAALVLSLAALCLSLGFAATAFFLWNELQQLTAEQAVVGGRIDERLQPLHGALERLEKIEASSTDSATRRMLALEQADQDMLQEFEQLDQRVTVLGTLIGRSDAGWSLAEVEYLLGIANKQLQLQHDVRTAAAALRSADAELRELADPHYLVVREQIAKDLDMLAQVPLADVEGIALKLDAWMNRIDGLPVAGTRYQPLASPETVAFDLPATVQDWKQLPALLWQTLKNHFRLREHDRPVKPMLAPEREYFLRENLRLQLSAAKLALLREDSTQFRTTLDTATSWLEEYFITAELPGSDIASGLRDLRNMQIGGALPDVSASLRLLRQQIKLAGLPGEVQPAGPEAGVEAKPQ